MEPQPRYYDPALFLNTNRGNRLSKQCLIRGTDNIHIDGKAIIHSGAVLRGDLALIKTGSFVIVKEEAVLRPTYTQVKGKMKYVNMNIGEHVYIDRQSVISALKIGNNVRIGKNVIIGHRSVIRDNCVILDDSILGPDTIVPPFTVFGGRPATMVGELAESVASMNKELTVNYYRSFVPKPGSSSGGQNQIKTHRAMAEAGGGNK